MIQIIPKADIPGEVYIYEKRTLGSRLQSLTRLHSRESSTGFIFLPSKLDRPRFGMIEKFVFVLLLAVFATGEIPSYIHVCGRRNPKLDECILKSVNDIADKLGVGIPELDVPSLNPLHVKNVYLADLPNFKASAADVKLFGLHKFRVTDAHLDLDKKQVDATLVYDTVRVEAMYDVNARILIPVAGHGPIDMTAANVKGKATLLYKIVERNGKNYMQFYSMTTKLEVGDFKANFRQEGDTDNTLSTAINAALVDSKQEILDSTIPNMEKSVSETILGICNKICKHFTYEELFPDRE